MDDDKIICPSCKGDGIHSLGDCEDGITVVCQECDGYGNIYEGDTFIPQRDAWTPRD